MKKQNNIEKKAWVGAAVGIYSLLAPLISHVGGGIIEQNKNLPKILEELIKDIESYKLSAPNQKLISVDSNNNQIDYTKNFDNFVALCKSVLQSFNAISGSISNPNEETIKQFKSFTENSNALMNQIHDISSHLENIKSIGDKILDGIYGFGFTLTYKFTAGRISTNLNNLYAKLNQANKDFAGLREKLKEEAKTLPNTQTQSPAPTSPAKSTQKLSPKPTIPAIQDSETETDIDFDSVEDALSNLSDLSLS